MRKASVVLAVLSVVVLVSVTACSHATNPQRGGTSEDGETSMVETPREHLVVLASEQAEAALAGIEAAAPVTQLLRPRLLLVLADPDARDNIRRIPGVLGVYGTAPDSEPLGLLPEEQLFVDAWAARRSRSRCHRSQRTPLILRTAGGRIRASSTCIVEVAGRRCVAVFTKVRRFHLTETRHLQAGRGCRSVGDVL